MKNIEDKILIEYLRINFKKEYNENLLTKEMLDKITDSFSFNLFVCNYLIKEIGKNIADTIKLIFKIR